jgi:threonine synthase
MGHGIMVHYAEHLPLTPQTPMISMGEGDTPLVRSSHLEKEIGCGALYFKLEGCNPTGSFKDRGMVVAVAKAMEEGKTTILCASTGNTSASAAAYGAYCGLSTVVLVPRGSVAQGKLSQAIAYGARIVIVDGNFDQALTLVRQIPEYLPMSLVNSVNAYRLQGQKTAAYEVVDSLGDAPDYLCIPVGNAGNITAYWMGFQEYADSGKTTRRPKMMGFQAAGAAPIVLGHPVKSPETVASAIRIGNPASWQLAECARDESGGAIDSVSDEQILEAYGLMASREGIFCEPASAASMAGLMKLASQGEDLRDKTVVCVITGTGLKDPDLAMTQTKTVLQETAPDLKSVLSVLGRSA